MQWRIARKTNPFLVLLKDFVLQYSLLKEYCSLNADYKSLCRWWWYLSIFVMDWTKGQTAAQFAFFIISTCFGKMDLDLFITNIYFSNKNKVRIYFFPCPCCCKFAETWQQDLMYFTWQNLCQEIGHWQECSHIYAMVYTIFHIQQ